MNNNEVEIAEPVGLEAVKSVQLRQMAATVAQFKFVENPNSVACKAREELLEQAESVERVISPVGQKAAVSVWKAIKELMAAIELQRQAIKDPFFQLGQRIDAHAKLFCEKLAPEAVRLKGMLDDYQRAEDQRVREENAKKQRELDRIAAEERQKAENARRAQEAADRAAREATNKAQADAAAKLQAEAKALADKNAMETAVAKAEVKAVQAPSETRPVGLSVKRKWTFEILDINVLYAARPDLCNPPTPKTADINRLMSVANNGNETNVTKANLPGIRVFLDVSTGV